MKKTNILFWTFTILFAAFMLSSAVPDILVLADASAFITALGYPKYIVPFLGVAKALGSIAILIPGFPRIKEWAYAGLFFDLAGATYSGIAVSGFVPPMLFMILPFSLEILSYYYHHKRLAGK
jgi:DoxX-like family